MNITIGAVIKYYPAKKDSRYFYFTIREGDSYDGVVRSLEIDDLINITVDVPASNIFPGMGINFNRVPLFDTVPVNPLSYGFAVIAQ